MIKHFILSNTNLSAVVLLVALFGFGLAVGLLMGIAGKWVNTPSVRAYKRARRQSEEWKDRYYILKGKVQAMGETYSRFFIDG